MLEDIYRYLSHYLVLGVLLSGGLSLFLFFNHSRQVQLQVVMVTALGYLLWGTTHHYLKKDLNWTVFFEYTLVAVFSILVIYTVLGQA